MAMKAKKRDVGEIPANFIRAYRRAADMTLVEVIEKRDALGITISEPKLSKMERSKHPVDSRDLEGLAAVFKTSPIALMVGPPGDPIVQALELLAPLNMADRTAAVEALTATLKLLRRAG